MEENNINKTPPPSFLAFKQIYRLWYEEIKDDPIEKKQHYYYPEYFKIFVGHLLYENNWNLDTVKFIRNQIEKNTVPYSDYCFASICRTSCRQIIPAKMTFEFFCMGKEIIKYYYNQKASINFFDHIANFWDTSAYPQKAIIKGVIGCQHHPFLREELKRIERIKYEYAAKNDRDFYLKMWQTNTENPPIKLI